MAIRSRDDKLAVPKLYALAALRGEPLLATGRDFAATDLTVVGPTSGT